jgi:hypothetical protein
MKIISKYKDYYDYLQGIYGIDEKIIYRRVINNPTNLPEEKTSYKPYFLFDPYSNANKIIPYTFAICGKMYTVVWCAGKIVTSIDELSTRIDELGLANNVVKSTYMKGSEYFGASTKINDETNCPIVLLNTDYWGRVNSSQNILNPKLSDFEFNRVLPPEELYLAISQFLSREPEIMDTRTNEMKIESYGFDKKTSFRH